MPDRLAHVLRGAGVAHELYCLLDAVSDDRTADPHSAALQGHERAGNSLVQSGPFMRSQDAQHFVSGSLHVVQG